MRAELIALGVAGALLFIVLQSIGTALGLVIHERVRGEVLIAVAIIVIVVGILAAYALSQGRL